MYINELKIYKCNRIPITMGNPLVVDLNGYEKIVIKGGNGSGKSTLMSYTLPTTPNIKKDFSIDGYRYLNITHNNINYELYNSSKVNSIKRNGLELNPGNTKTVFNQVIEQELNITEYKKELLLELNTITNMSLSERRALFMLMDESDIDYAYKVYKKLTSRLRDISGALMIQSDRLSTLDGCDQIVELNKGLLCKSK